MDESISPSLFDRTEYEKPLEEVTRGRASGTKEKKALVQNAPCPVCGSRIWSAYWEEGRRRWSCYGCAVMGVGGKERG